MGRNDMGGELEQINLSRRMIELLAANQQTLLNVQRAIEAIRIPQFPREIVTVPKEDKGKVNRLLGGTEQDYELKSYNLTTARTNLEILADGNFLDAWTDGDLMSIGVRLNTEASDLIYFGRRNPIIQPFGKLYLTHVAQDGKTLELLISQRAGFGGASGKGIASITSQQRFYRIRTDKDEAFVDALVQGDLLTFIPTLPQAGSKLRITGVIIISDQQLDYRLLFFRTGTPNIDDSDLNTYIGEVRLNLPLYGFQIVGGPWHLDVRGLEIDYENDSAIVSEQDRIILGLQNLSATAKDPTANASLVGAVADDGGVQTDETTAANNATANDMTLLPAIPAVDDAYYFLFRGPANTLTLNVGTAGVGTWTIFWEYLHALTGLWTDASISENFIIAGTRTIPLTNVFPSLWAQSTIAGITGFPLRARVSAYTAITTQPLGTQAWAQGSGEVVVEVTYEPRS